MTGWEKLAVAVAAVAAWATTAGAQPKPPALIGATPVAKLTAPEGFIDDPIALDDARVAYVSTDGSAKSTLHVVALATGVDAPIDLSALTFHAVGLRLAGSRALVIGAAEDGSETAALVELAPNAKKPVVYKLGPAKQISIITRDGKPRVALEREDAADAGTKYAVELYALETGARVGAGDVVLDAQRANAKLDFHLNHWADGMTRAIGIKGGEWDPKENQRTPDVEATYDLIAHKLVDKAPITDLFEQRKRYQILADAGGKLDFLKMAWDNTSVALWRAGKPKPLELDQAIQQYDPKSLQGELLADGGAWLALTVDPVNPDAVARQKADPEYLDVFRVGADGKAVRQARILSAKTKLVLGGDKDVFWTLERSPGFERGGKTLTIYKVGEAPAAAPAPAPTP